MISSSLSLSLHLSLSLSKTKAIPKVILGQAYTTRSAPNVVLGAAIGATCPPKRDVREALAQLFISDGSAHGRTVTAHEERLQRHPPLRSGGMDAENFASSMAGLLEKMPSTSGVAQ
jgi:hypothetical protein